MELIVFNLLPVNDKVFTISCNNEQIAQSNEEIASLCIKHDILNETCMLFIIIQVFCPKI